ncbi:MAG: SEL1-like repeat protein [Oscillospiraceae bacterium]|nr:SEL1-like repeat protein [Oscillospiraceae bacterium]
MARIIFISPYLKGGADAAHLTHHTKYIATREGAVKLKADDAAKPETKSQGEFIRRLLRDFPSSKELMEYADYRAAPSRKTASEFIDQTREQFITADDQRENFLDYISHRPGVKSDGDHGLWDRNGKVPVLSRAVEEVANHPGIVWTPIVSIRREDAERLGYTNAENWRALVNACTQDIAKGYKISANNLRWYAALHEKEKHFHIHMVVFSADPKEGYLTPQGIRNIKSAFGSRIFKQDLITAYARKTEYRDRLQRDAAERMAELIRQMQTGTLESERLRRLMEELAARLKNTKGKGGRIVYGYLPAGDKRIVDEIVDELAKDERVAEAYRLWQEMQDEVCRVYTDEMPERVPLSAQKEFKPVRNMVVKEALALSRQEFTFDDESMDDEPEGTDEPSLAWEAITEPKKKQTRSVYEQAERYRRAKKTLEEEGPDSPFAEDAVSELEKLWEEGYIIAAHRLGKAYRDGTGVRADAEKAVEWFRRSADAGNDYSEYALGKLLLEQNRVTEALEYLTRAAKRGNQHAQYRLGKLYLTSEKTGKDTGAGLSWLGEAAAQGNQFAQYALGKLYLQGREVEQDKELAVRYLRRAAAQGNTYAQYFLDHMDDRYGGSVGGAVLRMLHQMSRIFRENVTTDSTYSGMHIDRKRRRELLEKRLAMGHKIDDHEDPENNISNQAMR